MSIQVALHHRTTYRYDRPVRLGPQVVRLRPAPHCRTRVLSYGLTVRPAKHFLHWQQDPQANFLARLTFPEPTSSLEIEVDLVAEMAAQNPFDFFLEPEAETWPFTYDPALDAELAPYKRLLPATPLFSTYLAGISRERRGTSAMLVALNQELARHIAYGVRLEPGLWSPEETLERRAGSCRDTGWLLVQLLRHLGFAARFVSGYLIQLTADEKSLDGPSGPEADFCDLHAWAEVYLPGAGWIGLDPTSGLLAGEGHLPLAATAEPSLAAPVTGLVDPCEVDFQHEMRVSRIAEVPRVTKPYTEAEWTAIEEAGRTVDAALAEGDVRLTMGGEPTFVSVDDPDGAEWNTAALGAKKRELAGALFRRLCEQYGPGGLVHVGQGKWYPGEPLPRWSLSLLWRKDGAPLWRDPTLFAADEDAVGEDGAEQDVAGEDGAGEEVASGEAAPEDATEGASAAAGAARDPSPADLGAVGERLLHGVATRLGVDPANVLPAHEDAEHLLRREGTLPINVDPRDPKLDDPLERERLRRLFSGELGRVVGHVLPLARRADGEGWLSSPWTFRGGACQLVPGDSPLGLRLPLSSLPWADPEADRDEVARTALCAEARRGILHVFLPPTEDVDVLGALLAAVEATARDLGTKVRLEGYLPPRDARTTLLSVTPDPGVIEVNVQPVASWAEATAQTTFLYEAARQTRLSAEKFLVDGRHVGTGGGNHVVLGGATPDDSPFLRRPDLLRSLIATFHEHPSLSYLFSGMFLGPTSQAPRLDEARNDSVFEMEIAFRELDRMVEAHDGAPPPWLTDRLFRDLLVDVTGNTHRAELCIDKMFSPDGPTGRLGLLELRGLEMPPHPRMSLAQQLLLRALVAHLWREPRAPLRLTRWGTSLHDRFMLPHFVWADFERVLDELRGGGLELSPTWYLPHFEFRFPRIAEVTAHGVTLSLRHALEPWHVLGEDVVASGTTRFVDASVERLQVLLSGASSDRFGVAVNGVTVPLQPTGTEGELVAGVRFRAWKPSRCLHPHIEVHAPLTFDLVDRWSGRSLAGCQYHVGHPGGRAYETRPINALEAEGRRRARLSSASHTPGPLEPRVVPPSPDFPFTLDLRTT